MSMSFKLSKNFPISSGSKESSADTSPTMVQRDQSRSPRLPTLLHQKQLGEDINALRHLVSNSLYTLFSVHPTGNHTVVYGTRVTGFRPQPRLHALLIGINNYRSKSIRPLRGAEADAQGFKQYLENYLKVPTDQINILVGQHATRSKIIQAFKRLATDQRIQRDDAILIFYAGHGGEILTPDGWEAGGSGSKIQALIPHDCSFSRDGRGASPLPDRVIGALLDQVADAKGDNITVVFDCCKAASSTRCNTGAEDIRIRSANLDDLAYDPRIDQDILNKRTTPFAPAARSLFGISKSHILLAACESSGVALETDGHGNFTTALLKLLQATPPDELEYCNILKKMGIIPNHQKPQCEGNNLHRMLFDAEVKAAPNFQLFPLRYKHGANGTPPQVIVEAGSLNGISEGDEFSIIFEGERGEMILTVASVTPSTSIQI